MPPLKSSILLVRKGVSSSLPDGSVDDIGEKMVENDVFWSVQVIWDNFCLDAFLEKFHSPSQEGGVIITSWWICG